jgi:hypothetical protein
MEADEEGGDQGEEEELEAEDYEASPFTHAIMNSSSRPPRDAYQQAADLLDQSEEEEEESDPFAAHSTSPTAAVQRLPFRDSSLPISSSRPSSELFLRPSARSASSRRSSRGPAPDATEQLTAASASVAAPAARSRLDRGSLRTWVGTAGQLKQRFESGEREHTNWLLGRKQWFAVGSEELKEIAEMERFGIESSDRIKRERDSLFSEIKRLRALVIKFKTHIANPSDSEAYVSQLRMLVEHIEEALSSFKSKAKDKYIALSSSERDLTSELEAQQAGWERWTNEIEVYPVDAAVGAGKKKGKAGATHDISTLTSASSTSRDDSSSADTQQDISAIRAELASIDAAIAASGGSTGGWDPRDHTHFLKLRTQLSSRDPSAFLARVATEVNKSPAEVAAHVEWFEKYEAYGKRKKELVAKWKAMKEVKDPEGVNQELEIAEEAEKEEVKKLQSLLAAQRAEQAKEVAAWRQRKQEEEQEKKERIKARKEEQEREARERREDERVSANALSYARVVNRRAPAHLSVLPLLLSQRRLRSVVEAYHEDQAVHEMVAAIQAAPTASEIAEKERAEKEARRRRKEQQEEQIRAVKEKRLAKEAQTARLMERQEAMARAAAASVPSTSRDPSRLTQPTAAMVERARQREAEDAAQAEYSRTHGGRTPGTMLGRQVLGHTATPSWRKGI